jgi:hypothetical protein
MPGHGRENLQHELELRGADVCHPHAGNLTECVLAALGRVTRPAPSGGPGAGHWHQAFAAALNGTGPGPGTAEAPAQPGGDRAGASCSPSLAAVEEAQRP